MLYSTNPVYVSISLLPCPFGFMLTTEPPFKCGCNLLIQQVPGVECNIQDQTFVRSGWVWMGMIHDANGTNGAVAMSQYCPLSYCSKENINVILTEPDSQCDYNHSGILCGECQHGLSLGLGSEQCLPCSNKYLALLIPFTLAGPVLVGFIKLLDLTITQGTLNGLIFYANVVHANKYLFLPRMSSSNYLLVFIAWLNLDLGVETCLFQGLNAYYKTWLQFAFPLYTWSIAGLIIILSKYSNRVEKVMGNNYVPVLVTLIFLSYAKLFRIIITVFSFTKLYTSEGYKTVWSSDGNVNYLSAKHSLLFAGALGTLVFLLFPYTLLFFAQWLHKINYEPITSILFKLKPFLDAHYCPFKEKHCYWFGALHLARAVILLLSVLVPADHSSVVVFSILVSSVVLMYIESLVYHNKVVSLYNMGFFLNLILITGATLYTKLVSSDSAVDSYIMISLAFLQFIGLIILKVISIIKKTPNVMICMNVQQAEDDWELYEQAAILRDIESDSDSDSSEGSKSLESIPSY